MRRDTCAIHRRFPPMTCSASPPRVAVVGCGGLGGRCIDQLARIGVGTLVVIDADSFEPSNLNRQVLCRERDMGVPKAQRAAEYVHEIDGGIAVHPM